MMNRTLYLWLPFFLLSCSLSTNMHEERAIGSSAAYEEAFSDMTRTGESRRGVDTPARISAIMLTPDFRDILATEYREVYSRPLDEPGLQVSNLVFVMGLTTARRQAQTLRGYQELWTLTFITDEGEEIEPHRVERYDRDEMYFQYFFPFWTPWREMYRVEFPVDPSVTSGALVFRGVPGEIRLDW